MGSISGWTSGVALALLAGGLLASCKQPVTPEEFAKRVKKAYVSPEEARTTAEDWPDLLVPSKGSKSAVHAAVRSGDVEMLKEVLAVARCMLREYIRCSVGHFLPQRVEPNGEWSE